MDNTRKVLERIPTGQLDWRPHEKSFTAGQLAQHIANLPMWGRMALEEDGFDFAGPDRPWHRAPAESTEDILELFDERRAGLEEALAGASDETLLRTWTLRNGEHVVFSNSKIGTIRTFSLSHMVHHRGQMSVYLRLMGVPVPGVYGPSADERG